MRLRTVTVTFPDDLMRRADQLAEREGLIRSDLCALALREFIAQREQSAHSSLLDEGAQLSQSN